MFLGLWQHRPFFWPGLSPSGCARRLLAGLVAFCSGSLHSGWASTLASSASPAGARRHQSGQARRHLSDRARRTVSELVAIRLAKQLHQQAGTYINLAPDRET